MTITINRRGLRGWEVTVDGLSVLLDLWDQIIPYIAARLKELN